MATFLYVAASIALLALAGLFIYLITLLNSSKTLIDNVIKVVQGITDEISAIRTSLQGTIQNLEGITGKVDGTVDRLNTTMDRVNGQLNEVEGIVGSVRQMTVDASRITDDATDVVHAARNVVISIVDLEQDIQRKVQGPVQEVLGIFGALSKGIRAFREKITGTGAVGYVDESNHRSNGVTTAVYRDV
jgi:uncharacterized protein YoxC